MDPQISTALATIIQNQHIHFTTTVAGALIYLSGLVIVAWRLDRRMERRFDEGRKALADLHATSQAIVAQTAELLRRTAP